jgi:hypothetical protein
MRILGRGKRFSFAGVLCGLFLLTGVLQADNTWTVHNGDLYYDFGSGPVVVGDLTGSFTFDGTSITSLNLQAQILYLTPPPILFTTNFAGDSGQLFAIDDDFSCCLLGLTFLQPLTLGGGTVGISSDPDVGGLALLPYDALLNFNGAYATTPEPSIPVLIFVSAMGMVGLVYARRRRAMRTL